MKSLKVLMLVAAFLALSYGAFRLAANWNASPIVEIPQTGPHKKVESQYAISARQQKEVVAPQAETLLVYRYKDEQGFWQTSVGSAPLHGNDVMAVGALHKRPHPPEVDQALYLCAYRGFEKESTSLDANADCEGNGKPLSAQPAGYLSKTLRTGYLLVVRCMDPEHGMYLSLNARCESPKHRYQDRLGSIRAASLDLVGEDGTK